MKRHTTITIICLLIAGNLFSQNQWRVNNAYGIDADFTTVQAAVDSATAGDIIYIEGTNIPYVGFNIEKPLTFIGPGYFLASNDSTQANVSAAIISTTIKFSPGSEGSYMAGLSTGQVRLDASNLLIERNNMSTIVIGYSQNIGNVVVRQNYISTISDQSGYSSAVIKNNIVVYYITNSIRANWLIYNNTVYSNYSGSAINVYNSSIKNNIVINTQSYESYHCINTAPGQNNNIEFNVCNKPPYNLPELENNIWDADPALVLSLEGNNETKLFLIEGSPAIGYGENGQDCGAYGDLTPYVLSGMPPVPHIFKANVPVSATTTGGLPVNVKIKSQK